MQEYPLGSRVSDHSVTLVCDREFCFLPRTVDPENCGKLEEIGKSWARARVYITWILIRRLRPATWSTEQDSCRFCALRGKRKLRFCLTTSTSSQDFCNRNLPLALENEVQGFIFTSEFVCPMTDWLTYMYSFRYCPEKVTYRHKPSPSSSIYCN